MVDPTAAVIGSIIAGIAGGFLSSWMSFNASGEKFDGRKHGNALITGALAGMLLGAAQAAVNPSEISEGQFVLSLIGTFLAGAGVDRLRSSSSRMTTPTALKKLASGDIQGAIKETKASSSPAAPATPAATTTTTTTKNEPAVPPPPPPPSAPPK
jgi:hypothetical protein